MNGMQNILGHLRRADDDFNLISDGDKIAVALSGGKDSLTLLGALVNYQKFGLKRFELVAITVDCTDGEANYSEITKFCESMGVKHYIEPSQIFKIVFDIRKEKSACSLCAKLRRGIVNSAAKSLECNKVALGHHSDDMIETFLLCMLYEGRLSTLKPKTYLSRTDITVIRPLIYASEKEIIGVSKTFPILNNLCPVNGHTKREYMKQLVGQLSRDIPTARERIEDAVQQLLKNDLTKKQSMSNTSIWH